MELLTLIAFIVFWIIYYIFQGLHDVAFIKEVRVLKNQLSTGTLDALEDQIVQQELLWKSWDALEKLLMKLVLSGVIYFYSRDLLFALALFFLSVWLRWFIHDLVVALGLRKGINHIGPEFIMTDRILRRFKSFGVNQYVLKLLPTIALIGLALQRIYSQ